MDEDYDFQDFDNGDDLKTWEEEQAFQDYCLECENESAVIIAEYENGECPDCRETIPDDILDGEACENCGHVFHLPKDNDDEVESNGENETPIGLELGDGYYEE